jgi:hypothetical protein
LRSTHEALLQSDKAECQYAAPLLARHIEIISGASHQVLQEKDEVLVAAAANDYLMLMGYATGCWAMARSVLAVVDHEDDGFKAVKNAVCRFYFDAVAPHAEAHYQALQRTDQSHYELASSLL